MLLAGRDRWVETSGVDVARSGSGPPPGTSDIADEWLAPGFVDLQVNEGAATDAELLAHGVTGYLAAIVTRPDDEAAAAVEAWAELVADPSSPAAGIHLEGPFLAVPGVHDATLFRAPAAGVPAFLRHDAVKLVTLAPELEGAVDFIRSSRAVVSLGHSAATATAARAAVDAGARMVTHLFNAMAPIHHREPGLAGVALTDPRLHLGVIADGVHIDPAVLQIIHAAAGDRVILTSDATAGRVPGTLLAGSATLLDDHVRRWAAITSPEQAIAATSLRPRALLGLPDPWAPGSSADFVFLDRSLSVSRVVFRGALVDQ